MTSNPVGGDAATDLLGDEVFVRCFVGDTAEALASKCLTALINRYGEVDAKRAMRAELKRKRLTKGHAQNLMMGAMHSVLKEAGHPTPTQQVTRFFGGGADDTSALRRLRRVNRRKGVTKTP